MRYLSCVGLLAACSFRHGSLNPATDAPIDTGSGIDAPQDAPIDSPRTCPADFTAQTGGQASSRYKAYSYGQSAGNVVDFAQAKATCMSAGGYLAIPNNGPEIGLFDTISQNPNLPGYWVGITDAATEGVWLTVLGDPASYLPWKPPPNGQPNGGTGSNCVAGFDSELYDVDCTTSYVFICECSL